MKKTLFNIARLGQVSKNEEHNEGTQKNAM
jgi:hypothetical protein